MKETMKYKTENRRKQLVHVKFSSLIIFYTNLFYVSENESKDLNQSAQGNKIAQTGWLKPQDFILSAFWRLEVPDQGLAAADSGEGSLHGLQRFCLLAVSHAVGQVLGGDRVSTSVSSQDTHPVRSGHKL